MQFMEFYRAGRLEAGEAQTSVHLDACDFTRRVSTLRSNPVLHGDLVII